jgi:hypothetical protein
MATSKAWFKVNRRRGWIDVAGMKATPPEGSSAKGAENKRRAARVKTSVRAQITYPADSTPKRAIPIQIVDLAARGVGFTIDRELPLGDQFILHLPRKNQPAIAMLCNVCNRRKVSGRSFHIGAEFQCVWDGKQAAVSQAALDQVRKAMFE